MSRLAVFIIMSWLFSGCVIHDGLRPTTDWSTTAKTIDVARDDIIRIVTPFTHPVALTTSTVESQQRQHVLYLLASGNEPITLFVINENDESESINLTLIPSPDGTREIDLIQMVNTTNAPTSAFAVVETRSLDREVMSVTDAENKANSTSLTLRPTTIEAAVREVNALEGQQVAQEEAIDVATEPVHAPVSNATAIETSSGPTVEPWDPRSCKLCRDPDDNGSSSYSSDAW